VLVVLDGVLDKGNVVVPVRVLAEDDGGNGALLRDIGQREGKADAEPGDREHVVERGRSDDHRRHALLGAEPPRLHVEHARHDYRGRDGGDDEAEEAAPRGGESEQRPGEQCHRRRLREARAAGETRRDRAHCLELVEVESEPGAEHDD